MARFSLAYVASARATARIYTMKAHQIPTIHRQEQSSWRLTGLQYMTRPRKLPRLETRHAFREHVLLVCVGRDVNVPRSHGKIISYSSYRRDSGE